MKPPGNPYGSRNRNRSGTERDDPDQQVTLTGLDTARRDMEPPIPYADRVRGRVRSEIGLDVINVRGRDL